MLNVGGEAAFIKARRGEDRGSLFKRALLDQYSREHQLAARIYVGRPCLSA